MARIQEISDEEYARRAAALQASLGTCELEAFVVSSRDSLQYLTGVVCDPLERPMLLVIRSDRPPVFLVPLLERDHIEETTKTGIEVYPEYPAPKGSEWKDKLRELLAGVSDVGVEPSVPYEFAQGFEGFRVESHPLVEELRALKSPAEIELIRHASRFADLGVERLLAASYPDSTVAEGFAETRTVVRQMIAEIDDWEPLSNRALMGTWAAPRSARPHSIPKLPDRLRSGPHVALVLTAVRGYAAECERTYFTSPPSADDRRAFEVMLEARKLGFEMARPGTHCGEMDAAVNKFLTDQGYQENWLHRTGHGLGLAMHAEAPWIAEGSDDVLRPGMVISIEPGIYVPDVGGFRHSDTVLITEDGHECLTQFPTDLDSLVVPSFNLRARAKGLFTRRVLRTRHNASKSN